MCFRAASAQISATDLRCGSIRQNIVLKDDATHGFLDTKVDHMTSAFTYGTEILTHWLSSIFRRPGELEVPIGVDA
jgi:hypothetical protein